MTMQRSFYIGGFCISVHFTAAVTVAALMISDPGYSLIAVLCAALHELGHIMAARLCGTAVYGINFTAFGAELKTAVCKSYRDEIIICLGGPLMNVAAGALFFGLFLLAPCVQLLFAAVCCAFLAAVNMLPAAAR